MMNPVGPSGIPGLIPRGQQIQIGGGGGIPPSRVINLGGGMPSLNNAALRRSAPGPKLMRLRCRFRPLHDQYIKNGSIVEDDTDVIFLCGDGHQLRAHKVIMASSSKFFAKIFEEQTAKVAVVSVPDIKVDIMKLILQLTYRDRVFLTMSQIKDVGEFLTVFGLAWTQFGYEEYNGEESMTAIPLPPVPMKPVELPRKVVFVSPRSSAPSGQQRRIASVSPARSPMQQNFVNGNELDEGNNGAQQLQGDRRKSRLTPRPGTEGEQIVEQDEEDDPENLIRDWMSKLGKRESTGPNGPDSVKRMKTEEGTSDTTNVCSVCNTRFQTEIAWKWHEERHLGNNMFKCKFCDNLTKTPKLCYIHEKETHGFCGLQKEAARNIVPKQQPQQGTSKPATLVYRSSQTGKFVSLGHQNFRRIKHQTYKKLQASKKKPGNINFANKHSDIRIGESVGSELIDVKKIKQLHWLYVCARCDNCADSAQKAVNHYNRCYPDKEKTFEETVTKHRQGFYGKSRCPLCPRRYPQNSGFMIHCGHQHQAYRRLYIHTGNAEDLIKCNNCKEGFPEPISFHEHLETSADGSFFCSEEPKEEAIPENVNFTPAPKPVGRPPGKSNPPRPRRTESPIEHKASYKVQFHTPPKSARLASRVQAEAEAEAASKKATDLNFPPVDCPVCGDCELPNISTHIQAKHKDLNVDVTRISSELYRCKGCTITFDICDLLDHKNCLLNSSESASTEGEAAAEAETTTSRRTSTSSGKVAKSSLVVDLDSLPPGVGRSPIERIEMEDLHSIQAIRSALKCLVCGATAMRLGVIAECLRTHGIHRCSLCFNSYSSKADYALHLRKCHGASSNKLKCPLCPKAFANAGQTSGHMYSTHWLAILKENEVAMKNKDKEPESEEEETSKKEAKLDTNEEAEAEHEEGDESSTEGKDEKSMADDDDKAGDTDQKTESKVKKGSERMDTSGEADGDSNESAAEEKNEERKKGEDGDAKKKPSLSKEDEDVDIE